MFLGQRICPLIWSYLFCRIFDLEFRATIHRRKHPANQSQVKSSSKRVPNAGQQQLCPSLQQQQQREPTTAERPSNVSKTRTFKRSKFEPAPQQQQQQQVKPKLRQGP